MRIRLTFLCLVVAAMAACAGGGRSIPVTSGIGGGGSQSAHRSGVSLRMVIPKTTQITSARTRHPAFVAATVASIVYEITQGTNPASLVSGSNYTNVAATPSPCTASSAGLVCSISIPAAIASSGTYSVTIATYDAAQNATCTPGGLPACSGNLLGIASLPETITLGSDAALDVTLGGVPAAVQPISLSAFAGGSGQSNGNSLIVFGPQPQTGKIELLDADGNVIINPGAPQVTASSQMPSALTVAIATPSASSGLYTITFSPVLSGNYVQPGIYPVALDIAVPNSTANYTFDVNVQVAHSAVVVSTCDTSNSAAIYGYLDGNTNGSTPDLTITNLSSCTTLAPGLGTDRYGYLYVADGAHLYYYALAPGTNPTPLATANATQGLVAPIAVALDQSGFAYVVDQTNGLVAFPQPTPGQATFGPVMATIPTSAFSGALGALGADNSGNLYAAADPAGPAAEIYWLPSAGNGLTSSSSPSPIATIAPAAYVSGAALAIDVQPSATSVPDLWFGAEEFPSTGALWQFAPAGSTPIAPIATHTSGLQQIVDGVAIDNSGVVYAAIGSASYQVTELAPPSYAAGTTIVPPASSPSAIGVAVVPAAAAVGSNQNGGSPSPITTVSPAAIRTRP